MVTGLRLYPLRAALGKVGSVTGRTTLYIAVAHHMRTGRLQIGLGEALAVIPLPNARPVPGNKLLARAESSQVSLPRVLVWASLGEVQVLETAQQGLVARIAPVWVEAQPIA